MCWLRPKHQTEAFCHPDFDRKRYEKNNHLWKLWSLFFFIMQLIDLIAIDLFVFTKWFVTNCKQDFLYSPFSIGSLPANL